MPGLKLAIFDMDGTLIDSRQSIAHAMSQAFQGEGLTTPHHDDARKVVGLSLDEALRRLAPPDIGQERAAALSRRYKAAFVAHRNSPDFHEPMYDGALETLTRLKDEGWLMAIATGKSRRGVRAAVQAHNLSRFFDTIVCADDGPGKPHPFMVRECMAGVGLEPGGTLMIGDSEHDIGMGRAAGVHCIGVSWGFQTRDELEAAGAHIVFDKFPDLDVHLEGFPHGLAA